VISTLDARIQMKEHTCKRPEPESAMQSELAELDRIRALPRGQLPRQQSLGKVCFFSMIVAVASGVMGGIRGSAAILVTSVSVAFAVGAILMLSRRRARCPDCHSTLVYHESFCSLASGQHDDRILLECSACRKAWDAGPAPSHDGTT
jgi:hypothetical protein